MSERTSEKVTVSTAPMIGKAVRRQVAVFDHYADAERTVQVVRSAGIKALIAGRVDNGSKKIVIAPLLLTFSGDDLHVRA